MVPPACRPRGALLSPTLPYSGGVGLVTGDQLVALVAAFTEPVTGLTAASFALAGPPASATVSALQLVRSQQLFILRRFSVSSSPIYAHRCNNLTAIST